jgi:hypothetical protein
MVWRSTGRGLFQHQPATFLAVHIKNIHDVCIEHEAWLEGIGRANCSPDKPNQSKALYDLLQSAHPKTHSCYVICKAKSKQDVPAKWRRLNTCIDAAGAVREPLHLKIKAYHLDVEGGTDSALFPMVHNTYCPYVDAEQVVPHLHRPL